MSSLADGTLSPVELTRDDYGRASQLEDWTVRGSSHHSQFVPVRLDDGHYTSMASDFELAFSAVSRTISDRILRLLGE